jgi:hypothetical protein
MYNETESMITLAFVQVQVISACCGYTEIITMNVGNQISIEILVLYEDWFLLLKQKCYV